MTQIQKYISKSPISDLRNLFQNLFDVLSQPVAPFGGNLLEAGHATKGAVTLGSKSENKPSKDNNRYSENRYSVLYMLNAQYHHIGCSSQEEAQAVLGLLMTDGNRIPVGIYDGHTDMFEWEIIGQYFHSKDPISEQQSRLDEILTISRVLRRRDSSWQPGYLQKPSFFA
ncbi:hypothetical protein DYBT9275_00083 [Dyadobacter sp. CECT 9275]|uniref:Uncharacterized protein n=1 Tax=Dyadobacter helix TaxID=2822344 RepID=A0A916J9B7_9BACT|nr:hypothetical protein [Dyadobacter sp. CECT 9275]CAG4988446.1 hypothetical protein DYBT9275_00083 [Dyadobacter sp. CECT 9275]